MGNRNSGRRPKPTALKLLRGNPGKRRLNEREPAPPKGDVIRPAHLGPLVTGIWDDLAPGCVAMGTLTVVDVAAFVTLCELQATFNAAAREKAREDFSPFLHTTMVDSAGNEHQNVKEHPALSLERKTAAALRPYYEKFGLEPVGRARISVPKTGPAEGQWAELLA